MLKRSKHITTYFKTFYFKTNGNWPSLGIRICTRRQNLRICAFVNLPNKAVRKQFTISHETIHVKPSLDVAPAFPSFDLKLWRFTLAFEADLDSVSVNKQDKCICQRPFHYYNNSPITQTDSKPTALPEPLKWSCSDGKSRLYDITGTSWSSFSPTSTDVSFMKFWDRPVHGRAVRHDLSNQCVQSVQMGFSTQGQLMPPPPLLLLLLLWHRIIVLVTRVQRS